MRPLVEPGVTLSLGPRPEGWGLESSRGKRDSIAA